MRLLIFQPSNIKLVLELESTVGNVNEKKTKLNGLEMTVF